MAEVDINHEYNGTEIAIVGMAGRFPGAANIAEYWQNLRDGVESITFFSDDDLLAAGVPPAQLNDPDYVKAQGVLQDVSLFDAGFFGIGPRDAAIMDPQHRHFLECAWEALEHAGYDPDACEGAIGVFGGVGTNAYLIHNLLTNPDLVQSAGMFLLRHTSNDKDFFATRVSYNLNLKGPSINVQTACSTSLVAVHLAVQSLLNGETDMALAGGSTIEIPQPRGYIYKEGEILSADGHCRAFDASSSGTVFGSGAGIVVLKRLEDALADGDTVHAVIRASAVNNDGSMKVGYMAPSVDGQAAVYAEALAVGDVPPETVTYIEAHGTGTAVGDPIELAALTQAYGGGVRPGSCGIGSAKTNIGHLDTAAGIAGLIKVVMALKHRQLPPSLHFETPNPALHLEKSPFYVVDSLRAWEAEHGPRRAGVSSLGVGGTNAHVILEEAPAAATPEPDRTRQLMLISARSETALNRAAENLGRFLEENADVHLADAAYTLAVGRRHFAHRRIVVGDDRIGLQDALQQNDPTCCISGHTDNDRRTSVVFMFPGAGAQYVNMAAGLYDEEPVFRQTLDACLDIVRTRDNIDLRPILFPEETNAAQAEEALRRPLYAHPALFAVEYALARQWMAWSVEPAAMIGHSRGEYVAACLAGVMSLEDALRLVTLRGRLIETTERGGMLGIPLPVDRARAIAGDMLDIASINGPSHCVLSGPLEAIEAAQVQLEQAGIEYRRLDIGVGYHSRLLEPVLADFEAFVDSLALHPPAIPYVSNVTGTWITQEEAVDPAYWTTHLRGAVRFSEGLQRLLEDEDAVFLEVGPGRTLTSFFRMHQPTPAARTAFQSMRHPKDEAHDAALLLTTLGRLWLAGVAVDWPVFYQNEQRRRVPLPAYPFERSAYWIEPGSPTRFKEPPAFSLAKKPDVNSWFYTPAWKQQPPAERFAETRCLVFCDDEGAGRDLAQRLETGGAAVWTVTSGDGFARPADGAFAINPADAGAYQTLFEALHEGGALPDRIVYAWSMLTPGADAMTRYDQTLERCFFGPVRIARALGQIAPEASVRIDLISRGLYDVAGEGVAAAESALLLGPCRVIEKEFPNVACRNIDLPATALDDRLAGLLYRECTAWDGARVVAYRGHRRWTQTYEPVPRPFDAAATSRLKQRGVYLITGGLDGVGGALAAHLAETYQARLALVGRTLLPERNAWDAALCAPDTAPGVRRRIRLIRSMEAAGADVLPLTADVADLDEMRLALDTLLNRFGRIDGIVHAAAVLDDRLMALKEDADAAAVLAPKVKGALILERLLQGRDLDLRVYFTSAHALAGIEGQVDYTAGNAFLDAFACQAALRNGGFAVSVAWSAWQETGVAARTLGRLPYGPNDGAPYGHPFVESTHDEGDDQWFWSRLSPDSHWILDEHRLRRGDALIPGTGYLEIVRAAFSNSRFEPVDLIDVSFMTPFVVPDGRSATLFVRLRPDHDGRAFSIESYHGGASPTPHVSGRLTALDAPRPAPANLDAIRAACQTVDSEFSGLDVNEHLAFGPRWDTVETARFGANQALAHLALPDAFHGDLDRIKLHPAMLDIGFGYAQRLVPGFDAETDFYVPFSISHVRAYEPTPARLFSHVVCRNTDPEEKDVAVFDIRFLDEKGQVLLEVEEFVLRRVDRASMTRPLLETAGEAHSSLLEANVQAGIATEEGIDAFERILAGDLWPQAIVSSQDLPAIFEATRKRAAQPPTETAGPEAASEPRFERPSVSTAFEAPRSDVEAGLAEIWQEVLGINRVGIHDDFFELGGHSLLLTQALSRIRALTNVNISLRVLFESPTIAAIAAEIERRSDDVTAPVAGIVPVPRIPQARPGASAQRQNGRPAGDAYVFPASVQQRRFWFIEQFASNVPLFNIPSAFRLKGSLHVEALEKSLDAIVRRHEALRTTFASVNGEVLQIVAPDLPVSLPLIDLSALDAGSLDAELARRARTDATTPFDVLEGPLFRAQLLRLSATEHVLLLNIHHLAYDVWSIGVLSAELKAFYAAYRNGASPALPDVPVQYADYTVWQHAWLQSENIERQLAYWKSRLSGDLPVLPALSGRSRPPVQSYRGAWQQVAIPKAVVQGMRALSQQEGCTLFMAFLAAFKSLIHRYTGHTDVIVGGPSASRNRPEIEGLIGLFINTLVYRSDLSDNPTFRGFMKRVRETAIEAYEHQDVPIEQLVETLQPRREMSHHPLFQAVFTLQDPWMLPELEGLTVSSLWENAGTTEIQSETSKFDLFFMLSETDDGVRGIIEYSTDLYDQAGILRLWDHYLVLLDAVLANPDVPLGDLPLLTAGERRRQLTTWNDTAADYPSDACMHTLFERQAVATPESVAVRFEREALTYAELNDRANRLAHYLQQLGAGPGVLVGLFIDRSVDMVVALLGVLKTGAAYVPLDPSFPAERLQFMIVDAEIPILIAQSGLRDQLPAHAARLVFLDDEPAIAQMSADNPNAEALSDHLAYVIYTSGSTGLPKGVQIQHRALINFLWSMQREPGLAADDVLASVTTLSFDIAALEIYLPLVTGATLVVLPRDVTTDGRRLAEALDAYEATIMQATPATWRLLLDTGWSGRRELKMLCGGEALPAALANSLAGKGRALWNMYGPTETTIWSSVCEIDPEDDLVSIGRPIANTQFYILNERLQLVPEGAEGALYIGGDGLASGYLKRPELTRERFIENPFGAGCIYHTGDVARYLPDGRVECLGRLDYQVKIRGFRIELGEIEAVLENHDAVEQAVVVAREDAPGDPRLAAYLVVGNGNDEAVSELRSFARSFLPEYMVPSHFLMLDRFPLTPNGKVDRKALPAPAEAALVRTAAYQAPRTDTEAALCAIWQHVLRIPQAGVNDEFFDLGGNSLLIIQLIAAIDERFGIDVPLRVLFEHTTIAMQALLLESPSADGGTGAPPTVVNDGLANTSERLGLF